jgi:hypothetical protein
MSARGVDFLNSWMATNITDSERPGSRELATILAARCKGEAASKGIGLIELEPEFVTVEMAIYEAMAGSSGYLSVSALALKSYVILYQSSSLISFTSQPSMTSSASAADSN